MQAMMKPSARRVVDTCKRVMLEFFFNILDYVLTLWDSTQGSGNHQKILGKIAAPRAIQVNPSDPFSPYRSAKHVDKLISTWTDDIKTIADIPKYAQENFKSRKALATRELLGVEEEIQPTGEVFKKYILGEYHWVSYNTLYDKICRFGDGLLAKGVKAGDTLMIYCETRMEWLICAMSCFMNNIKVSTIYPTLGPDAMVIAINSIDLVIMMTSANLLEKLGNIIDKIRIKTIIYANGKISGLASDWMKAAGDLDIMRFEEILEMHAEKITETEVNRPKPDDVAVVMFTSGSSGVPKAVSLMHKNMIAAIAGMGVKVDDMVDYEKSTLITYLPLAHIFELCVELLSYAKGLRLGYSTPNTLTNRSTGIKRGQLGDMHKLQPNLMIAVPMVLDVMYYTLLDRLQRVSNAKRTLFHMLLSYKREMRLRGWTTPFMDKMVFRKINKLVFGGNMEIILCGGAPLTGELQDFLQCAIGVTILQGYGLTETCSTCTFSDLNDMCVGTVGGIAPSIEIRFRNWEEGGYRNTDKPEPRGEILIGGNSVAAGYHNQTEESVNFIEIEGTPYFCTGDIGQMNKLGCLKIIDRKKDIIKTKGGEYVSLAKVEGAMKQLQWIQFCCVLVHPDGDFVGAIVVPDKENTMSIVEGNPAISDEVKQMEFEDLIKQKSVNNQLVLALSQSLEGVLQRFEIPKTIHLTVDSWTPENGLLTPSMKVRRRNVNELLKEDIQRLFAR